MNAPSSGMQHVVCVLSEPQRHALDPKLRRDSRRGVELVFQDSPELALDQIGQLRPPLVLVGMSLDGMEGLEFLALLLRRHADYSGKVIVVPDEGDPFPPMAQYRDAATGKSVTEETTLDEVIGWIDALAPATGKTPAAKPAPAVSKPEPAVAKSAAAKPEPAIAKPSSPIAKPSPAVPKPVPAIAKPPPMIGQPAPATARPALAIDGPARPISQSRPRAVDGAAAIAAPAIAAPAAIPKLPADPELEPTIPKPRLDEPAADVSKPSAAVAEAAPHDPEPTPPAVDPSPLAPSPLTPAPLAPSPLAPAPLAPSPLASTPLPAPPPAATSSAPIAESPSAAMARRRWLWAALGAVVIIGVLVVVLASGKSTREKDARGFSSARAAPAASATRAEASALQPLARRDPEPAIAAPSSSRPDRAPSFDELTTLPIRFERRSAKGIVAASPQLDSMIEQLASALKARPRARVQVGGHASKEGPEYLHSQLGEQRALEGKRQLVEHGIKPDRIVTKNYAATRPLVSAAGEDLDGSRRVTVQLID